MFDKIHEECGVIGIYDFTGKSVSTEIYHGLYALQHRGQESCGIVTNDDSKLFTLKNNGLVSEVLGAHYKIDALKGNMGVGHVRYAKTSADLENVQPLVSRYCKGSITLSYNGNIMNAEKLRGELEQRGTIFQSFSAAEVIMNLVAIARTKAPSVEVAVLQVMKKLKGAYSFVLMSPRKIIAARDPHGFHPLVIGKTETSYVVASETSALDTLGATFVKDVLPGQVIKIDENGMTEFNDYVGKTKSSLCLFEYVYFARPDSIIDGNSVYDTRIEIGRRLAKFAPCADADCVIGVPDSGLNFAQGYAYESGLPYREGLIRNRYAGRVFIKHTQSERDETVGIKLSAIRSVVEGKSVALVDDSIVRGTTCGKLIQLLKKNGAKKVHMRIASPLFRFPCYYGTDVPSKDQLIANQLDVDGIAKKVGADSLGFLPLEQLRSLPLNPDRGYCDACFSGEYPIEEE